MTDDVTRNPAAAAFFGFALPTIVGAATGYFIGATRTTDGSSFFDVSWGVMTEQPLENADKVFNWLIFGIFVAAGCVAAAAAWAGSTIAKSLDAMRAATPRATVGVPAPKPPAPPTAPGTDLDPPHL